LGGSGGTNLAKIFRRGAGILTGLSDTTAV
jgi:hypothetical protein